MYLLSQASMLKEIGNPHRKYHKPGTFWVCLFILIGNFLLFPIVSTFCKEIWVESANIKRWALYQKTSTGC